MDLSPLKQRAHKPFFEAFLYKVLQSNAVKSLPTLASDMDSIETTSTYRCRALFPEDAYKNFEELSRHEREGKGKDFEIEVQSRGSKILVMAPHGGAIEPYTASLAKMIAGNDFSCYTFRGIKKGGNRVLHITSHRFDEPRALEAAGRADIVVAMHGANNDEETFIMVGGLHRGLSGNIEKALKKAGFHVEPPGIGMNATHPFNICNRGSSAKGVQLELTTRNRRDFKLDHEKRQVFVDAIRGVLLAEEQKEPLSI